MRVDEEAASVFSSVTWRVARQFVSANNKTSFTYKRMAKKNFLAIREYTLRIHIQTQSWYAHCTHQIEFKREYEAYSLE